MALDAIDGGDDGAFTEAAAQKYFRWLAGTAAAGGVSVDVFAVGSSAANVAALAPVSEGSGGLLVLQEGTGFGLQTATCSASPDVYFIMCGSFRKHTETNHIELEMGADPSIGELHCRSARTDNVTHTACITGWAGGGCVAALFRKGTVSNSCRVLQALGHCLVPA